MAPSTLSAASHKLVGFSRRTHAPCHPKRPYVPPIKKYRSMKDIMERARYVVVEQSGEAAFVRQMRQRLPHEMCEAHRREGTEWILALP
ncbi:putative Histone-lysine N-methyltransferase ATXR5 [Sesbania bispinosa]|nr:putative Histone-lysine N-methyltransferase ATXR5 [Sesbania bispinosa]